MLTPAFKRLHSFCMQNRFLVLLIAILSYLLAFPFLQPFFRFRMLLSFALTFLLISAVYAVSERKRTTLIAGVIAVLWGALQWASNLVENPALPVADGIIAIIFMIYIIYNALHFFVNSKKIDFNIVIASIVVYLLIALVWAEAYNLIEMASPGSFKFAVMISEAGAEHFTYFSFITITTLGYGDIIPATNLARAVSMLEAFVGQVYLVVLVARLVGMQIAQSLRE
jgi:hypothetical protein